MVWSIADGLLLTISDLGLGFQGWVLFKVSAADPLASPTEMGVSGLEFIVYGVGLRDSGE